MNHPFKIGQEHLPYPNGGGLKAMSNIAKPKSQSLEVDALKAKHEVELQKLREKHASANRPKLNTPKKPPRRTQGR